jgi:tRNA dimethylallyltransferase
MFEQVVCLMGPTASGKTAIALELIHHFPCEIVSVDSAMVYQGMDIGTAKPDADLLARAPHHLIDCCPPNQAYSAAEFCTAATRVINDIQQRQHLPLLVGGTMMYFRALQQGLSALPSADPTVRAELAQQQPAVLHARLQQVDPVAAQRIHPHDTQRIQRALEVYLLTEKPLSAHLSDTLSDSPLHYVNLGLFPQRRAWLHQRIEERLHIMLAQGFLAEVASLVQQWQLTSEHPSMRSVGYRQALAYLQGEIDYPTFCAKVLAATRQLAKRQLTWLRSWPEIQYFDPEMSACTEQIIRRINDVH